MLSERDQELIVAAADAIRRRYRNDWQEVGAALRTRDGRIYTGVNLDAYLGRMAVCAEAVALGQARGIAMLVPAMSGLPVAEYAPNLVKKTIVGAGHCEKAQIRMMIGVLLPKADPQSEDAADALAIAVCHAHHRRSAVLKVAAG